MFEEPSKGSIELFTSRQRRLLSETFPQPSMILRFAPFLLLAHNIRADTIDNGLSAPPFVECGAESLTIRLRTQDVFEGHVYVKGHYSNRKCRTDATLDTSANLTVSFSECDALRQRSSNPKGIMVTSTVIVSFHPMFITKIDRSYKVQCFYAETQKTVTNELNVSDGKNMEKSVIVMVGDNQEPAQRAPPAHDAINGELPLDRTEINVPLPECRYQVLQENIHGEPVKFATVGQTVYHQWICDKPDNTTDSVFCATVHSCNVREESGREVQLLDENGCAIDKYLLNNLEYTDDLSGGQVSQVFKFADQPSLFFQCQIRLSVKEGAQCVRSSDHCPATLRGKRSTDESKGDVDVISQHMTVFDIDEPLNSEQKQKISMNDGEVCVTPLAAGSFVSILASLLLVSLISIGLLCCRPKTVVAKLSNY